MRKVLVALIMAIILMTPGCFVTFGGCDVPWFRYGEWVSVVGSNPYDCGRIVAVYDDCYESHYDVSFVNPGYYGPSSVIFHIGEHQLRSCYP